MRKPEHDTKLTADKIRQHQGRLGRGKKRSAEQQRILAEEDALFDAREKEQALQGSVDSAVGPVDPSGKAPPPQLPAKSLAKGAHRRTERSALAVPNSSRSLPYRKLATAPKPGRKSKAGKSTSKGKREIVGRLTKA